MDNVLLIDSMGSDKTVVDAARVSFNNDMIDGKIAYELKPSDKRLIKYLSDHNHWSPFSHCHVTFKISAPIFVARQLMKHQIGLAWNEVSRRYVSKPPEFWQPKTWREKALNKNKDQVIMKYMVVNGLIQNINMQSNFVNKLIRR